MALCSKAENQELVFEDLPHLQGRNRIGSGDAASVGVCLCIFPGKLKMADSGTAFVFVCGISFFFLEFLTAFRFAENLTSEKKGRTFSVPIRLTGLIFPF